MTGAKQVVYRFGDYKVSIEPYGGMWRVATENLSDKRLSVDEYHEKRTYAETAARKMAARAMREMEEYSK